jgi:transcriptional regulator
MYIPAHFAADDATVRELLARHGAADLVTLTADGLLATMLPFAHEPAAGEHGALYGHVARTNDQWREPALGESLAIVRGPDAYVSPSWYAAKAEHGRVVPTWNYVTAHVYGRLVVHDDPAWVEDVVRRLTAKHEAARLASPGQVPGWPEWSVDDAPRKFIEGQLRAIVGLELQITRIEAKAKLSQNRPATDIPGVVAGLAGRGDERSAAAVEQANQARAGQDETRGRRGRHPARSGN